MKALKSIFVWILLFALPLQGFAAVSMSLCDSGTMTVAAAADMHHGDTGTASAKGCEHHQAKQSADESGPDGMAKCST